MKFIYVLMILLLAIFVYSVELPMDVNVQGNPQIDWLYVADANPIAGQDTPIVIQSMISYMQGPKEYMNLSYKIIEWHNVYGWNHSPSIRHIGIIDGTVCEDYDSDTIVCNITILFHYYTNASLYQVTLGAKDSRGYDTPEVNASFEYASLKSVTIDTSYVSFGNLSFGNIGHIYGDADMNTTTLPTIRNTGNQNFTLTIHGTDLTGSSDYIGIHNVSYGVSVPTCYKSGIIQKSKYNVCLMQKGIFANGALNFDIQIPYYIAPGAYTGSITIDAD